MATSNQHLAQQGLYDDVLGDTLDSPGGIVSDEDFPWVVAALTLVGRTEEAEGLYRTRNVSTLTGPDDAIARHFYATGICRARKFGLAKETFIKNYSVHRSSASLIAAFYAHFGLAFFRYSTGRYHHGMRWIKRSMELATGSGDLYAMVLAHELAGHLHCKVGNVQIGIRHLGTALKKSAALGRGAVTSAVESSISLYRATYGLVSTHDICAGLLRQMETCGYEESYTRAALRIELAHQTILQGNLIGASKILDDAGAYVYQVDNPYLEITYKLCLALLLYHKGNERQALPILKECAERAQKRTHDHLRVKALGFQWKIIKELGLVDDDNRIQIAVRKLTASSGSFISKRILSRQIGRSVISRIGEDPLGDLLDQVSLNQPQAMTSIFATGYLSFLKPLLNIGPADRVIVADLEHKKLTVFSEGSVAHGTTPYTNLSRKLIALLCSHHNVNKDLITEFLWGQNYNPLRHDNLIYSLVNRTRKILGAQGAWLQNNESGYFFACQIEFRSFRMEPLAREDDFREIEKTDATKDKPQDKPSEQHLPSWLNIRQQELLVLMRQGDKLRAKDVVAHLGISEATASRDLAGLVETGLASRLGAGRATYYISSQQT